MGCHVMANVRNGDQQPPAPAPPRFGKHRIIKILGVLTIDSDQGGVSKINAPRQGGPGHPLRQARHLLFDGGRPAFLETMSPQHDGQLPFIVEVPWRSEDSVHLTPARAPIFWIGG